MAAITPALIKTLHFEGGYSNNPSDTGGETYRGISRNNFPHWQGWSIVDANKPLKDEQIIHNETLDTEVAEFYRQNFWGKIGDIVNQDVANKVFDMSVNMGQYRACILLQQAIVNDARKAINIDGKLGAETIQAANQVGSILLQYIIKRAVLFYETLAENRPEDKQFLNGWLKRANS